MISRNTISVILLLYRTYFPMLNSENISLKFAFFLSLILKLFFYFSRLFYQELTSKLQFFFYFIHKKLHFLHRF